MKDAKVDKEKSKEKNKDVYYEINKKSFKESIQLLKNHFKAL